MRLLWWLVSISVVCGTLFYILKLVMEMDYLNKSIARELSATKTRLSHAESVLDKMYEERHEYNKLQPHTKPGIDSFKWASGEYGFIKVDFFFFLIDVLYYNRGV